MRRANVFLLVILGVMAPVVRAESLSLVGSEMTWLPGENPSCQFTLGINNDGVTDVVCSWQLELKILPASGEVFFGTIDKPVSDYIFGYGSNTITVSSGSTEYHVWVSDFTSGEGTLPETGMSLLQIELESSGASGRFDVAVVPLDPDTGDGSFWLSSDYMTFHGFDVVTPPGLPAGVVASVTFVPEPAGVLLVIFGMIAPGLFGILRWKHASIAAWSRWY